MGWKDTVLVPIGSTIDILHQNPGLWHMHCHIAEHLGAGMETVVKVSQPLCSRTSFVLDNGKSTILSSIVINYIIKYINQLYYQVVIIHSFF